MSDHIHTPEDTERVEVFEELEKPLLCEICQSEADMGFKYKTQLGRATLCEDCLRVITTLGKGLLEWGHDDE